MESWLAPGFESPRTSLLLCLLVAALIAASLVWVRLPGPVTPAERARRGPGGRLARRLAGLSALLGPLLLGTAVWSLVFPLRQPQVVVLVTRSRPPGGIGDWKEKLQPGLIAEVPWGAATIDAGRLVDQVCRNPLLEGAWRDTRDPALATAVRGAIRAAMSFRGLATARVEAEDWEGFIAPASGLSPCRDQPRWLIESIEISVLRALVESTNVVEIRLAGSRRKTALGEAWEGLPEVLASASPRARLPGQDSAVEQRRQQPSFVQLLPSLQEPSALHIAAVLGRIDAQGVVRCLVAVPPGAPPETTFLLRWSGKGAEVPSKKIHLAADPAEHLIVVEAQFDPASVPAGALEVSIAGSEVWHPIPSRPSARVVRILAPPQLAQRWRATARVLSQSTEPAIEEWRRFRTQYGLAPGVDFTTDVTGGWDTVIDTRSDPRAVLVYPRTPGPAPNPKLDSDEEITKPILRGRVTRNALPGVYSLDLLPLAPGVFPRLRTEGAAWCDAVLTRRVALKFEDGLFKDGPEPRTLISRRRQGDGWLTWIGFRFDQQGMLLGADGKPLDGEPFDTARLLAGWTQLLAEIDQAHAVTAGCEPPAQVEDDPTHPVSFLDAAEQAAHRRTGTLWAVALFALGLALYGSWLVRGLRRAPGFTSSSRSAT